MSDVTFSGLASGLSTDTIVTKLMAVERAPIDRLTKQKTTETTKLQAYAQLNTRLDDLRKAADAMNITSEVRTTKANLSSDTAFSATSTDAATGSYSIAVAQLAQVQKSVSNGYSSNTAATFGTGTLTVKGTAIAITASNNSLSGIKAAINAKSATTGVQATIINDGKGANSYYLLLTGKDAATSFSVVNGLSGGTGTALTFPTTPQVENKVAKVTIDGTEVISNSNTLTDVISGVTLNLKATSPVVSAGPPTTYTATQVDIVADSGTLKEKISTFVSSYNKVMDWINQGYVTKTAAETAAAKAAGQEDILSDYLRGDGTVRSVKQGLQSLLTNSINGSGSLHLLSDIGITTNIDGTLTMDSTKVNTAVTSNLDGMVSLLAGSDTADGLMKKFNTLLLTTTSTSQGMYAGKKKTYNTMATRIDAEIARKETLMTKIEKTMRARFTAMESLVSSLNAQSAFLTQQFSSTSSSSTSSTSN